MLDTAMQRNSIKSDSIATDNRNHSETSKKSHDGKFESMLAKAKTQEVEAKAQQEAKTESKGVQKDSKDKKQDRTQAQTQVGKANAPFEFKDSAGGESKIGLQEKISKSTKENQKPQDNPLAQILSSSSLASANVTEGTKGDGKQDGKIDKNSRSSQAPMARSLPLPTQRELATQAQLDSQANPVKTLADVQDLAKQKNLNPGKIVLEDEVSVQAMQSRVRSKVIPDSAKEKISYEYENNTDRIAIVQRGVKKPKNITSKISPEYPTKKTDEDVEVGRALPKERPQLV